MTSGRNEETLKPHEDIRPADQPCVQIEEFYTDFAPRVNVRRVVERLLRTVPHQDLLGLGRLVLTNAKSLNRARRREKIRWRGKKEPITTFGGLYHYPSKEQPAWIEIFVDRALEDIPSACLHVPLCRGFAVGRVLFHELGHHLSRIRQGCSTPNEELAEEWADRLMSRYLRQSLALWLRLPRPILRLLLRVVNAWREKLERVNCVG